MMSWTGYSSRHPGWLLHFVLGAGLSLSKHFVRRNCGSRVCFMLPESALGVKLCALQKATCLSNSAYVPVCTDSLSVTPVPCCSEHVTSCVIISWVMM